MSWGWRGRSICVHQFSTVVTRVGIAELWKWKGLNQSQGMIICCPVVSQASVLPVSHMIAAPGSRVTCYFTASKWDCGLMILMNKPLLLNCITTFTGPAECCQSWLYSLARVTPRPLFLFCSRYAIMKMCWNLEPTKRPTFCKIGQMIEKLLGGHLEEEQVS